jgi:hypothetical protein
MPRPRGDDKSPGMASPEPTVRQRLDDELEAALMRELSRTWSDLNHRHFKSSLRPPVMRVVSGSTILGAWHRSLRILELSRELVLSSPWSSVVEVLKHEMAHQYAHEVLGAIDETAHGPAFRQVCERMGVDPGASGMPPARDAAKAKILEKIENLLALATSDNRHEAENAAALAQRLILKHNIALGERAQHGYAFRQIGEPRGRVFEAEHLLAAILAEHFFVEAIWVPAYRPHDGKRGTVLEICGSSENLEMASYVHAFLLGSAERLWLSHKRAHGIAQNRERRRFIAGVMEGFRERLESEKRKNTAKGLVWVGDARLSRFYRARHPNIRSVRLRGHGQSDARSHGREAGRHIILRRGLDESARSGGRALPPKR